jgi:hypothetical protein
MFLMVEEHFGESIRSWDLSLSVSPLLPNSCHVQNNDQSMSQICFDSGGCSPKMCVDEVNDERRQMIDFPLEE